jgi:hypothetical protein
MAGMLAGTQRTICCPFFKVFPYPKSTATAEQEQVVADFRLPLPTLPRDIDNVDLRPPHPSRGPA